MPKIPVSKWLACLLNICRELLKQTPSVSENPESLYFTGIRLLNAALFRRYAVRRGVPPEHFDRLFLDATNNTSDSLRRYDEARLQPYEDFIPFNDIEFPGQLYGELLQYRPVLNSAGDIQFITTNDRRSSGAFYTPEPIITYIVQETVIPLLQETPPSDYPSIRICDPAMGAGGFLIEAARQVSQYWSERIKAGDEKNRQDVLQYVVTHCIYGMEYDPSAAAIAKAQIALYAGIDPLSIRTIITADTLLDEIPFFENLPKVYLPPADKSPSTRGGSHPLREGGKTEFDAVIGNPPWQTYGLRGVKRIPQELNAVFRQKYSNTAEYKISVYALFIEKALQMTRPGGLHSFIVPDSWLTGKYFSKLRRYLLDEVQFSRLVLIEKDFWRGLNIGRCVVYTARKKSTPREIHNYYFPASIIKVPENLEDTRQQYQLIESARIKNRHLKRIVIYPDKTAQEIVERMEDSGDFLGNYVTFYSGLIGKKGRDSIIVKSRPKNYCPTCCGMLIESGRNLGRNRLVYTGCYIQHNPALYKSGYDIVKYRQPKLFINQTGYTLKACYDERGFFCLNNLHIAVPARQGVNIKFYAALLNSSILNYYYRVMSMEHGRALAQTDIDFLCRLPHGTNKSVSAEITELIEKYQTITINRLEYGEIEYIYEIPFDIQNRIERLFARWYEAEESIKYIRGEE